MVDPEKDGELALMAEFEALPAETQREMGARVARAVSRCNEAIRDMLRRSVAPKQAPRRFLGPIECPCDRPVFLVPSTHERKSACEYRRLAGFLPL